MTGLHLQDTQSGLRGIPGDYVGYFKDLPGERFDFELNMLLACKKNKLPVYEQAIKAVYFEENRASNFKLFSDSLLIYSALLGFSSVLQEKLDPRRLTVRVK